MQQQQQPTDHRADAAADVMAHFVGSAAAGIAFVLCAVTTPLRSRVSSDVVFAMLLILVASAALLGSRRGAAYAAVVAAFSFDFFHVSPLRVLHLRTLVLSGIVLGAVALAVRPSPIAREYRRDLSG